MEERPDDGEMVVFITLIIIIPILLCNLLGNSLVIFVLTKCKKFRSPNTYLLVHLAYSDLSFAIVAFLDIAIPSQGQAWLTKYILHALVSIYILTTLAMERYFAILKPFVHRAKAVKPLLAKVILGVWVTAVVLTGPGAYISFKQTFFAESPTNSTERETLVWLGPVKTANTAVLFTFGLVLPSIIMSVCYSRVIYHVWFNVEEGKATNVGIMRSRRKLTKLFVSVTIIFFITWTPSFGRLLVEDLGGKAVRQIYEPMSILLAMLGSMANPVLYSLRCPRFRSEVKARLAKRSCLRKRKFDLNSTDFRSNVFAIGRQTPSSFRTNVMPNQLKSDFN